MAIRTTVYVTYDTARNKLTLTGGNTTADDGTCDFDAGPGNSITFEPAGANQGDWSLTDVTWTPISPDVLAWEFAGSDIVLTDNSNESVRDLVVFTCTLHGSAGSSSFGSDPVIINKPIDGVSILRMSSGQPR